MLIELDDDAFGDAQIHSKLALAESIEQAFWERGNPTRIDFYAGWYGIAPFLLMSRDRITVDRVRSFDIDPRATAVASRLCRHWSIGHSKAFQAFTFDVNKLRPILNEMDMVVNTAVEHMASDEWFQNIPSGTMVILQGTDMVHPNEVVPNPIKSLDHFHSKYPLDLSQRRSGFESARINFDYPTGKFSRFQIGGLKP